MKRNLLLLFLLSILMLLVSVDSAYARTDCSGYKETYPDHYCACNYDCTRIQNLSALKDLHFNDSIWFKTTLKTFTEAGMTAYLFSESDVQVDIYQNCRTFNKMHQFTVSKNQTRDLDHQTILDKLEQNGASTATNTTIYVLFYPLEEGADCRLMCYPYNTGPNSTAADPLPVLIGMTYVSSHANDVYELKAEAIPTTYALYTQWKEENNAPCNLKVKRGSANGPVVAEHDFLSAETNFYFDPALLAEVKASGESLYMHYEHDASAAGRIQVVEGKVTENTIDVTECQGKTYQINGTVFTESAVYTTMAWINATTLEKATYNIVFTEPEAQYDTLRVHVADMPYTYQGQFTIPVSGDCDYDFTIHRDGECDERVLLHVIRMNDEYMTICHGDAYTWHGNTYSAAGDYTVNVPSASGCNTEVTLHLTVLPATVTLPADNHIICYGNSYEWYGKTYNATGTYTHALKNVLGCDSLVYTLNLTVLPETVTFPAENHTICHGNSYEWYGKTYNATGTYTHAVKNVLGCDSLVYTLNLTVLPETVTFPAENHTICHGNSYEWYGETYNATGTYTHVVKNMLDCDSLVYTLNLIVLPEVPATEESATICYGETYTWHGQAYTVSGDYTATLSNAYGCDSVVMLHLTVLPEVPVTEESAVVCYGETYTWHGQTYTVSGDYTTMLQTVHGCDSVVVLHLTVLPEVLVTEESAVVCYGESYTWQGKTYSASGDYTITMQNIHGCDSVLMLHLTVLPEVPVTEESVVVCYGETYTWHGETYSASGDYTVTYATVNGCDSTFVLHLTVLPEAATSEETVVACDSYLWYGTTYTESGDYTYVTTTNQGCEHTALLHLTIHRSVTVEESATICHGESYTWNGQAYAASGDYTITLQTVHGCDSVVVLHLTVLPEVPVTEERATICHGETYTWQGKTYTASGDYTVTLPNVYGCDSVVVLHLTVLPEVPMTEESAVVCYGETYTWNGQAYAASGDYTTMLQTVHGCDSVVVLHLTVLPEVPVTEESATICYGESYTWNGETYTVSGDYTITLLNVHGCDSVAKLHLTVLPEVPVTEESVVVCYGETYTWHGETYSASGDYTVTYATVNGCDSTFVLHLTVLPEAATSEETVVACDSYLWYGTTYTESGTYTYVTTAVNGCEHTAILHLTINKSEAVEETVTACDSYEWNGVTYTESGDYVFNTTTAAGCERIETLHLILHYSETVEETVTACDSYEWNGVTYTESGDYTYYTTTVDGCDRTEILHLTIEVCSALENVITPSANVHKVLEGEQIIIIREGKSYTLMGQVKE